MAALVGLLILAGCDGVENPNVPDPGIIITITMTPADGNITAGGTVGFQATATGGVEPYTWSWNFDSTSVGGVSPATSTAQNPGAVSFANQGSFTVTLTVTDTDGLSSNKSAIVAASVPGGSGLIWDQGNWDQKNWQ